MIAWVLGVAVRVVGASGELWLDEIWSWSLAKKGATVGGVLAFAHDNNHPLNTLWMLAIGETDAWIVYRAPALVAAAATLALVAWMPLARGRAIESAFAALLFASSFLLVTLQSEARGYALAILAAVVGYAALSRHLERPSARTAVVFGAAAVVGVWSHLTWLHAYAGLAAWSALHVLRAPIPPRERVGRLVALHAVPLAAIAVFWAAFVRRWIVGGGPERELVDVLASTLTLWSGAPHAKAFAVVVGIAVAALIATDSRALARAGRSEWVLAPVAVVVAPALSIAVVRPEFVAERYFAVALVPLLVVFARRAAAWTERGVFARSAACALVLVVCAGNVARVVPFLRDGRGDYLAALRTMQSSSRGDPVTIGSNLEFDLWLIASFYGNFLADRPALALVRAADEKGPPDWIVVQSAEHDPRPSAQVRRRGTPYRLVEMRRYAGLSGCHWILYRRDA